MGAHQEEEFVEFEGFAQEEADVQSHAVKLPIMAAGDDDDGRVTSANMAAQDFVEGGAIEAGEADIQEDEVRMQAWDGMARLLSVGEEGELPVRVLFERVKQEAGEIRVVFDNGDMSGRGDIMLK